MGAAASRQSGRLHRYIRVYTLFACIFAGAFACYSASEAHAQTKLRTLKLAYSITQPNFSDIGLFYAMRHGLFAKYGLQIDVQMLNGDSLGLQSLVSGDADMAWISNQLLYQAIINKAPIKGFIELSPVQDYELIATREVTDIKAMVGRMLATSGPGGIAETLPFAVFREKGIDPSKVRTVNAGGTSGRLRALAGGRVDAAMGHIIDRIRFEAKVPPGKFHVISNFGKDLPHFQFAVVSAQTKVLDSRLDDFIGFAKGLLEGTQIVANDEEAAIAEFSHYPHDMTRQQLHEAYAGIQSIGMFAVNGGIGKRNFEYTLKVLRDAKIITEPLTYSQAYDTRPKEAAIKALGMVPGDQ